MQMHRTENFVRQKKRMPLLWQIKSLALLEGLCKVVSECLPTTLEEDQRQLAAGNAPETLKLALQYRVEKKKLLRLVGETCRTMQRVSFRYHSIVILLNQCVVYTELYIHHDTLPFTGAE